MRWMAVRTSESRFRVVDAPLMVMGAPTQVNDGRIGGDGPGSPAGSLLDEAATAAWLGVTVRSFDGSWPSDESPT